MLSDINGVIFDLDGTLIDSMWIWNQIDIDYLKGLGFAVPKDLKDNINNLTFEETAKYFKKVFNIKDSVEVIIKTWSDMAYYHYSNTVSLKRGALDYLNYLKNKGIKIALATSNSNELLTAALKKTNIYSYFDSITTTAEVKKGKSNPDVYLLAAKKLGISPNNCLVFEDILEAVNGSKLANMKVIAVYDKAAQYQRESLIQAADKYIIDFYDLL